MPSLESLLAEFRAGTGCLVVLTGAGVSAESGIPTFRGRDGFWTIGSVNYTPMQMATNAMFRRAPAEVWAWYLARFSACRAALPNAAHVALAAIERAYGDRMALVTQNIDGLHQRAGASDTRTFAIHGDARRMRCGSGAHAELVELPELEPARPPLPPALESALRCRCGAWMRPHVLWFDEYYEEALYRSESALAAAARASLLLVVGTTGQTSLPIHIGMGCFERQVPIIDVNLEDNPFSQMAAAGSGVVLREAASVALPRIARLLGVEQA